jgi:hypothetical protein
MGAACLPVPLVLRLGLGWAVLASSDHALPGRDHIAVAELLAAVGNPVEPRFLETAGGPLYAWLEGRLGAGAQ